jgi:imidazolonepropionase-like amidohydrolase
MVVEASVAQRINFRSGRPRGYPASLMGTLAYLEQVLSDARHYGQALDLYRRAPLGKQRPAYDRTLQPILDALEGERPFLLPGDHGREIDRALELAASYGLRPVIYGGQGAYSRVDRLAAARVPVLVSLDWPPRDEQEEKARDPEADVPFRELYHRRAAPTTPQRLGDAGVRFAFTSLGASSPSEALEGVRVAIAAGLEPARALRALTLDAAEIFGVADRLGSIEAGKIANLVVASAEPWAEDVEIAAVFVDGRLFQKAKEEPAEKPSVDATGTWTLTLSGEKDERGERGEREVTAHLKMAADGKVTGEVDSQRGTSRVEKGRVSGSTLTFETTSSPPGSTGARYRLEITGEESTDEEITGTMRVGAASMTVVGERRASAQERGASAQERGASGEPDTAETAASPGASASNTSVTMAELDEVLALYQGKVRALDAFAITNATVWTVSGATLANATVLVRDGKIVALGTDVDVPRGVETIDGGGGHLIPGIIDTHSHLGVEGGVNEGSLAVTSMVSIADVLDPDDVGIYRALAGGVTVANTLHGSANPIGGGNATIKFRWGADAAGLLFEGAPPGIKFALGENPKRSRAQPSPTQRYPATRMGVMDVIRQAFTEAKEYQKAWQQYRAALRAGDAPIPPRVDLELEPLVEILEGKRLVHAHCYRADEMLQLLRLAEEVGFRIATLQHVLEGYKVADEIAAHGAGAGTFSDWWGYKVEAWDAIPHNAALMHERGVLVSINSDSDEEIRHLNQEAAKAVKWGGMDEVAALSLVTLNAAKQLGIADRVGSIEVGKDADLALFDGHPLSVYSVVQKTFVDGDLYFDRQADRVRQERVDALKERLLGRVRGAADGSSKATDAAQPARKEWGAEREGAAEPGQVPSDPATLPPDVPAAEVPAPEVPRAERDRVVAVGRAL